MLEVSFRGYESLSDKDTAHEKRYIIVEKLIEFGANPEYCKSTS